MQRPVVVFPQPLSPTSPSTSPCCTENDTPSTARTCPTVRENSPFLIGKYFLRSVDLEQQRRRRDLGSESSSVLDRCASGGGHADRACRRRSRRRASSATDDRRRSPRAADPRRHFWIITGQRGWKRQPAGNRAGFGTVPGMTRSRSTTSPSFGSDACSPAVYGCSGVRNAARTSQYSTTCPPYITATRSRRLRDDAEIVRDEDDRHPQLALQLLEQLEDLRLNRHVERRRRLVGDQHGRLARQRHRDHHALAHAARHLMRILVDALRGRRNADALEHLDRPRRAPARAVDALVQHQRLDDLLAARCRPD